MESWVEKAGLKVSPVLVDFVENEALVGLDVTTTQFWEGLSRLIHDCGPKNRALLATRKTLQEKISAWHHKNRGNPHDAEAYRAFLTDIGYIVPQPADFTIETSGVDTEIAGVAGPQLVVPITNARYALNAANARWGSLYDALYGTDALGDLPAGGAYDPARGARVVAWAKSFLDDVIPLKTGSWSDLDDLQSLAETLADPGQYLGKSENGIILKNNGLHIHVVMNPKSPIGQIDPAGIADIKLESALSAIMDCEDSVACVDAADKVVAYRNWLGLMKGDLSEIVEKNGKSFTRRLNPDLSYEDRGGEQRHLKGRTLMWVRNVGHLMTNPSILDRDGFEVPEGLMDAMLTVLCACHDLAKPGGNSAFGSIYIVKPKMHGPEEVAFADEVFTLVEQLLSLPQYTVKLGIMDEERRTSVNLAACIHAARHRVAFINTGFLDRTGDEIHTSMAAGPMLRKVDIKNTPWIAAYEDMNVDTGLAAGLQGVAQIGKGMWAMPDLMAAMLEEKINHPKSGANCAWVPSPTAATLHATHYHRVDVFEAQDEIKSGGARGDLADLLLPPVARGQNWSDEEIRAELENNAQGILGYVVRWVDQGVGCSKVPDINDVGLMEDRATCRISSQHMANWLEHGIVTKDEVIEVMQRMAAVVDRQNAGDPLYRPMAPTFDGPAFRAACDLVLEGAKQPSGYTEPLLHRYRLAWKSSNS